MAAPLADLFSLASWGGGTDEFGNPSYLQTGMTADGIQNVLNTGALTPTAKDSQGNVSGGQGFQIDYSKLPKIAGTNLSPQDWSPWANSTDKLINSKALVNDPNYGWITPTANIRPDNDLLSKVGGIMPMVIMALASAATLNPAMLGGQFGGGLGAIGGGLFKGLTNTLFNQGSPQSGSPAAGFAAPLIQFLMKGGGG